jgi:hypothetical protein
MTANAETSVRIDAPVDQVWSILSDLEGYGHWNSRTYFSGTPALGARLRMRVKLFGLWLSVPVTLQSYSLADGVRWKGGIPALYTGSHYFRVVDDGDGGTVLVQGEDFSGVFVSLIWPLLKTELYGLYEGMNREVKAHCEQP